jgi:hypothetical protein
MSSNFIAILVAKSKYQIDSKESYTTVSLDLPRSKWCSYSAQYCAYGIFNFTILSEKNINKTIIDNVRKFGAYPILLQYQSFEPFIKEATFCILENKYLIFNVSLVSGENNFILCTPITIIFRNASFNSTFVVINFTSPLPDNIFVNRTLISIASTNITLKKVLVNNNNVSFRWNESSGELIILNLNYTKNLTLALEYEDLEKPIIGEAMFVSEGKKIDKLEKGKDIYLSCEVTDNNILENVTVYYNDGSAWRSKNMFSIGNNKYKAWLGSFENDLEVYVKAVDISGNEAASERIFLSAQLKGEQDYQYLIIICSVILIIAVIIIIFRVKK